MEIVRLTSAYPNVDKTAKVRSMMEKRTLAEPETLAEAEAVSQERAPKAEQLMQAIGAHMRAPIVHRLRETVVSAVR